ncbi:MAG: tetratricopeptide repeat protein [Verrucomicrobia bacterium]|nr:tetratricopeptide repeat protein [Verrucomicrobiota bacterium]
MAKATVANDEIETLMSAAQEALRRGDVPKTIALYRAVLARDPGHGLANYWLGVLALKASMPREALIHLQTASARHPELPDIHIDLGLACQALGDTDRARAAFNAARGADPNYGSTQLALAEKFEGEEKTSEALEACQRGLLAAPQDAGLLRKLAGVFFRLKQWPDSIQAWRELSRIRPDCPVTQFALGEKCYQAGVFDQAADAFRRAVELRSGFLSALLNLGLTLRKLGDARGALVCFQRGVEIDPGNCEIHKGLGDVHRDLGNWPEANAAWRRAVELRPGHADAWQNLGLGLEHQNRLEEALECHRRVVGLRPNDATAHRYFGMILQDLGQFEAAQDRYREALRLNPNDAESHWQVFSLLAARGDFPRAWEEHEWRWTLKNRSTPKREFAQPRWRGEELAGRSILLYSEQGFGDTIQAARYVPLVQARGGRVLLWCPPDMVPLLSTLPSAARVFSELTAEIPFDCHLPMMSLPLVFRTTLATIPNDVPYLSAPLEADLAVPRSDHSRPRVGLVWCGSLSQPNDRRPVPFERLALLLQIGGVEFYSLQKGAAALPNHGPHPARGLIDLGPQLSHFGITAAAIEQLDLVITVDTAVAHLAGALGKPVWVLLSFAPDWRWMLDREDSPWYPTMRLFRQIKPGCWEEVIERVGQELTAWLRSYDRSAPLKKWLGEGLAHHQAGRLPEAERAYRRILRLEPARVDALRLMGLVCRQRGDLQAALGWLEKAAGLQPHGADALQMPEFERRAERSAGSPPAYHFNISPKKAADEPSALQLESAHVHHDLGSVWFELGKLEDAVTAYRKAVEILPSFADAHYNLGNAYYALKRSSEAETCYRKALEVQPDLTEARYNLGLLAHERGKLQEAIEEYRRVTDVNPAHPDALLNLGLVLKDLGQHDDAEACYRRLLQTSPDHARGQVNLASVLISKDELEEAENLCRRVLRHHPGLAEAWLNLGVARQAAGNVTEAIECFQRALELRPQYEEARYNLGIAELLAGHLDAGWQNYEARWRTENPLFANRGFRQPHWQGQSLRGRTLFVHCEQGLGDAIHFARYLPLIAQQGASVVLECPQPLVRLLAAVQGVAKVVPRGGEVPPCDFHVPLLSLPHRMKTTIETIPSRTPYLRVPKEARLKLPPLPPERRKIGLAWAGSPLHGRDRSRSISFRKLRPILSIDSAVFFSLQVGAANRELSDIPEGRQVVNLEPQLTDFAVTASAIEQLDLVICVDTAVAHLAGALGKPVWVLLPYAPDWRWLLGREDSPWYPTMRLFRQPRRGDWDAVIEGASVALRQGIGLYSGV